MTEERGEDIYDPAFVKDVFDRCSGQYIAFSYVCSMGFTERWRHQCVAALKPDGRSMTAVYDLMAGTGEVWPHLLKAFPQIETITAVDISSGMHQRALERLHRHRAHRIDFIEDDVLASQLPDQSADFVVATFGLKTFNDAQHEALARLIARVLKPGGVFSLVEASDPESWWLRPVYNFHLRRFLPLVERALLRGAQDFAMIGRYTANFRNARGFADKLRDAGLNADYRDYFFGCASGVAGSKPL